MRNHTSPNPSRGIRTVPRPTWGVRGQSCRSTCGPSRFRPDAAESLKPEVQPSLTPQGQAVPTGLVDDGAMPCDLVMCLDAGRRQRRLMAGSASLRRRQEPELRRWLRPDSSKASASMALARRPVSHRWPSRAMESGHDPSSRRHAHPHHNGRCQAVRRRDQALLDTVWAGRACGLHQPRLKLRAQAVRACRTAVQPRPASHNPLTSTPRKGNR